MPNYKVGVSLNLRGNYGAGLSDAAGRTRRFGRVAENSAGRATRALRRTSSAAFGVGDAIGRTARGGWQSMNRLAGAAGNMAGALDRTAGAARRTGTAHRRMADDAGGALRRMRRGVDGLIDRYRVLSDRARSAGGAAGSASVGRLLGAAGGVYGVSRVVMDEAALSQQIAAFSENAAQAAQLDPADTRRRIEQRINEASTEAQIPREQLLEAMKAEFTETGQLEPILVDGAAIAKVLMMDPEMRGADLGGFRASLRHFSDMDDPAVRERAMNLLMATSAAGAISPGEMARLAPRAMSAQTSGGNRSLEDFFVTAHRARQGFGNADTALTSLSSLLIALRTNRTDLTQQIGFVAPDTSPAEIADRLMASVGGDVERLPAAFRSKEIIETLAGITGQAGRKTGEAMRAAVEAPDDRLRREAEGRWERQTAEPAAAMAFARDVASRDMGDPLLGIWRPATQAIVTHLPKIELGIVGLAGVYGASRAVGGARRLFGRWRGAGAAGGGGTPAGGGPGMPAARPGRIATMHVGTLIARSMPGPGPGAGRGVRGTPGGRRAAGGARLGRALPWAGAAAAVLGAGRGVRGTPGGRPAAGGGWPRVRGFGLGRALPWAGAAIGAWQTGSALVRGDAGAAARGAAGAVGGWGGALAGAKMGALAGALAGPIGAAVGGAIGAAGGSLAGWWGAGRMADFVTRRPRRGNESTGRLLGAAGPYQFKEDAAIIRNRMFGPRILRSPVSRADMLALYDEDVRVGGLTSAEREAIADDLRELMRQQWAGGGGGGPSYTATTTINIEPGSVVVHADGRDPQAIADEVVDRLAEEIMRRLAKEERRARRLLMDDGPPQRWGEE